MCGALSDSTDTKVPPETPGTGFAVHPSMRINEVVAPLGDVRPLAFLHAYVEVLLLTGHCVSRHGCFWIQPYKAEPALPTRRAAGQAWAGTDSDDLGRSSGSDGERHTLSVCSQSGKDKLSFCSSADSDVEMDPGSAGEDTQVTAAVSDGSDGSQESGQPARRAAAHTHTAWQTDSGLASHGIALFLRF